MLNESQVQVDIQPTDFAPHTLCDMRTLHLQQPLLDSYDATYSDSINSHLDIMNTRVVRILTSWSCPNVIPPIALPPFSRSYVRLTSYMLLKPKT